MNSDSSIVSKKYSALVINFIAAFFAVSADFLVFMLDVLYLKINFLAVFCAAIFFACQLYAALCIFRYKKTKKIILSVQQSKNQKNQWKENKRQAQYLALQNQINPHFLYNTLESIRSEALVSGLEKVADMSENLANYFRYTISVKSDFVTLADEIQNVRDYFSIQKFRFGDRISLEISIPDDDGFHMYRMPKLILQPIVENSLIHGLESKIEGGTIKIRAEFSNDGFYIYVEDNGIGIPHKELIALNHRLTDGDFKDEPERKQGGIAIKNVNDRIKLIYGSEFGLTYFSLNGVGTTVEISLPAKHEN